MRNGTAISRSACRSDRMIFLRGSGGGTGPGGCRSSLLPAAVRFTGRTGKLGIAGRCRLFIIEPLQQATLHLGTEDTLDAVHHGLVFPGNQREGIAGLLRPAGAADPVRVGIRAIGHVVVDDVGYSGDIDAAGGNVGRYEDPIRAVTESVECGLAPVLRQISLQRGGPVAGPFQLQPDALGAMFGPREDQDRLRVGMAQQFKEERGFEVLGDRVERMGDRAGRCGGIDLHLDGAAQNFLRELPDIIGHGRPEEQGLPLGRNVLDDLPNIRHKAHIKHPVRFVQYEHFHA